jgi:3-phenylpropionate/trans-cinnamate dioxygenase ferredoxin reductase component
MATRGAFVIVGGGLAGAKAAEALRASGFAGPVVLVGDEPELPYERPPLSKEVLRGEQALDEAFLRPEGWYEENGIELRLGERAERLDTAGRAVELAGGERIPFDRALIATGSRNRSLEVPGADLDGVVSLRTADDALRIREAARRTTGAVLVGMGFIGSEVAASLRASGVEVTAVEFLEAPLARVLGVELGRVVEGLHRDHGVRMHFGEGVAAFEGNGGRLEAVVTSTGRRLECDLAVVGVGVRPNVELAEAAGLPVGDGVLVDATLETPLPGVFAAGDVALHDHPLFGPIRVEHFDNALKMGEAAARNLLGEGVAFDDAHWFWSDQYDANLQMAGYAPSWDRIVYRGSVDERAFSAFFLSDGVLRSVFSMNRPREVRRAMPLIGAGASPDPSALRDEDVDLRTLASAG